MEIGELHPGRGFLGNIPHFLVAKAKACLLTSPAFVYSPNDKCASARFWSACAHQHFTPPHTATSDRMETNSTLYQYTMLDRFKTTVPSVGTALVSEGF
eukprot:5559180-Amphidinium_carterae.2